MAWRLAESLIVLRDQVNKRWPNRSKESDGSIGDESHSARTSDHNPDTDGVVKAIDITHDPKSGFDSYAFAEVLRASRDPRIKYIISNKRIASSEVDPWQWRPYHGQNPHDHHVHISVRKEARFFDEKSPWNLDAKPMPDPVPLATVIRPTLRMGAKGEAVEGLQKQLGQRGIMLDVDGDFGKATFAGVKRFQQARGLLADGVCGPQTWAALNSK